MPATEPLCRLIGINPSDLSREECIFLEAELLYGICEELKENFRKQYSEYFRLMKFTMEMENAMLEENLPHLMIKDILITKEYTLEGIAHYVNTHEDVVHEIISGLNRNPSAMLLRRVIELHKLVRSELYKEIMKKIVAKYGVAA